MILDTFDFTFREWLKFTIGMFYFIVAMLFFLSDDDRHSISVWFIAIIIIVMCTLLRRRNNNNNNNVYFDANFVLEKILKDRWMIPLFPHYSRDYLDFMIV